MAKHSSGPAPWALGQKILAAFVALLVVVGGVTAVKLLRDGRSGDDGKTAAEGMDDAAKTGDAGGGTGAPSAGAGEKSCTPVTVWAAPALVPAAEAAVESASDDCFSYVVVPRESATAQSALRGGEEPDVWLADSTSWPELMSEAGVDLNVGTTIASTPVLLAGVPQVIDSVGALGIGPETDWAGLLATYQELATSGTEVPVSVRVGDPRVDPATMSLLSSTSTQEGGWADAGSAGRAMLVVLAQTAVQGDPVAAVASDPRTVIPATEQQLAAAAEEGLDLKALPLKGGLGVVRMPFVRVGDTGSAQAVDALEAALTSDDLAQVLTSSGLRPGTDGAAPGVEGVPEGTSTDAPEVAAEQVVLTAKTWTVIAPQSRILTLIDISGSMEVEVGDTTRIDLTRAAAQTALSVIPDQTAIGVWYFATALDGKKDYKEVVPLRPLNEEVRSGVTQKDLLLSVTDDLGLDTLTGDTGLHDSLWAAYQAMQEQYTPESISSVLLLTDGMNDDTTGGLSEKEVIEKLTAARETGDRPVTVVLIGMGPEVDADALERLAKAAGGESLVLRDPRELPQVFVDVVARRAS